MTRNTRQSGFTLVEMMMALLIASIVLAAVTTLASATTSANDITDQMGRQQALLRQATMRLTDLIRRANRVTATSENGFELWHDNNADGIASADELTHVQRDVGGNGLRIGAAEIYAACRNVTFGYDAAAAAETRFITTSFTLRDNGTDQMHRVNARLRLAGDD